MAPVKWKADVMGIEYPIIDVTGWKAQAQEELGRQPKIWLAASHESEATRWLLKRPKRWPGFNDHRVRSWEDVNEKIVSEIAQILGIPAPRVELATHFSEGKAPDACIVEDFSGRDLGDSVVNGASLMELVWWLTMPDPALVDGNQSPLDNQVQPLQPTLDDLESALAEGGVEPHRGSMIPKWMDTLGVFLGYLMLDALVLNDDRNPYNWAVIQKADGRSELGPSFDHGSALANELDDIQIQRGLADPSHKCSPIRYMKRCLSSFCRKRFPGTRREIRESRIPVLEAFTVVWGMRREAGEYWLDQLRKTDSARLTECVRRVPSSRQPEGRSTYLAQLLIQSRDSLLTLKPTVPEDPI